jgi:glycosyltransferase involved in cell wall biosynthesis
VRVALHSGQLLQAVPGGIGRYTYELLTRLPSAGVDTTAFAAGARPAILPDGVRWVDIGWPRGSVRYELWHRLEWPRLPLDADVVHAPSLAIPPAGKTPLVSTIHDVAFVRVPETSTPRAIAFHTRGLELARRRARVVLTPSRFTRDELLTLGFDEQRIIVAPLGVTAPAPRPDFDLDATVADLGVSWPYVLHVGTIEPRKDLNTLIDAVTIARRTHPELVLAVVGAAGWGEQPDLDRPGVRRLGPLGDRKVDALTRRATACVVASVYEGFGLPVLEALVRGAPTIVADTPALREVAGEAALVFPARDATGCAELIVELVENDALRRDLGHRGPARATAFTWDATVRDHVAAYETAARS